MTEFSSALVTRTTFFFHIWKEREQLTWKIRRSKSRWTGALDKIERLVEALIDALDISAGIKCRSLPRLFIAKITIRYSARAYDTRHLVILIMKYIFLEKQKEKKCICLHGETFSGRNYRLRAGKMAYFVWLEHRLKCYKVTREAVNVRWIVTGWNWKGSS